ncbi:hypothetical protein CDAR_128261 [Caerostris darwini]|uniref:Uncharacterized protein n=1 Tax=Caerostris darwini TaxID=1538125 RepID=A0AAV4RTX5_9ARAC|nr:hypothetical protein CDAR_128221 [Caerostris darwini]GIY24276.1 hypothetical protein CDAR_128261 [Caerostris darwini]
MGTHPQPRRAAKGDCGASDTQKALIKAPLKQAIIVFLHFLRVIQDFCCIYFYCKASSFKEKSSAELNGTRQHDKGPESLSLLH